MFATGSTLQRSTLSGLGAALISAACIFGVAAPVKAAAVDAGQWQRTVEDRFDAQLAAAARQPVFGEYDTHVLVKLDGQGKVAAAQIIRSSGVARLDCQALRAAQAVRYPQMPGKMAGTPAKVELHAYFGTDPVVTGKRADKGRQMAEANNQAFFNRAQGVRLAAK